MAAEDDLGNIIAKKVFDFVDRPSKFELYSYKNRGDSGELRVTSPIVNSQRVIKISFRVDNGSDWEELQYKFSNLEFAVSFVYAFIDLRGFYDNSLRMRLVQPKNQNRQDVARWKLTSTDRENIRNAITTLFTD